MTAAAETRVAVSGKPGARRIYHLLLSQTSLVPWPRCGLLLDETWTLAAALKAGLRCCRHCEGAK